MRLGITVLGSGSKGNAILLHTEEGAVLVDAGFSRKELIARIASCGLNPGMIKALLISHEHGDHVNGARLFSDDLDKLNLIADMLDRKEHHMRQSNLEDIFLKTTGRKLNEQQ